MVGEQLAQVLRVELGDCASVFDYGDPKTFRQLWAEEEGGTLSPSPAIESTKPIVIVWGGREDPDEKAIRFAADLTPLDWALAYSLRVLKNGVSLATGLRVHVIDLTGQKFVSAWAVRMRHQLLVEMPWVSLHAPLIPCKDGEPMRYRRAYRPILQKEGCTDGLLISGDGEGRLQLAEIGKPMPAGKSPEIQRALENMAQQWAASLVQGTDHHNVNNIVGPVILSRLLDLQSASLGSPLLNAFVQKLNWTNAVCGMSGTPPDPLPNFETSLANSGIEKMRVLVIDDELERGWDGVVCGFLSKNLGSPASRHEIPRDQFARLDNVKPEDSRIQIWGCSTPKQLLDKLGKNPAERFFVRDLQSPLFNVDKDIRAELLVLDLRLFREAGSQDSRAYILDLVTRVREWGLCKKENLAWPPIEESELQAVEGWLRASKSIDPTTEASAITLLPRILALAAPLTPIMLFSSTGRADIKQRLKPYRNILTGFSKPQALQDFATIRESISEFSFGVLDGIRMLAFRSRLAKCMKIAGQVEEEHQNNLRILQGKHSKTRRHIDYYFDESGLSTNRDFVLASAATVFESTDEAERLQKYLGDQASSGNGQVPVWNVAISAGALRTPLKKYSLLNGHFKDSIKVLADAITLSGSGAIRPVWTSLCVRRFTQDLPKPISGENVQWTDKHLDLMLNFSVQFNFCVLPRFLGFKEVTCNLYFDRRSAPPTNLNYGDPSVWNGKARDVEYAKAQLLTEQFGCEITEPLLTGRDSVGNASGPRKVLVTTYPESAYYPFVREALVGWEPRWTAGTSFKIVRGQQLSECPKGYGLTNNSHRKKFDRRRWLHDIADWVAGANRNNQELLLKGIFPKQLTTKLEIGLVACLRAARSASWARADECIRALMENPRIHDLKAKLDPVESILIWACRDTLRHAGGSSLHVLVNEAESSRPHRDNGETSPQSGAKEGGDSMRLTERPPVLAEDVTFSQYGPGRTETTRMLVNESAVAVAPIPADPWAAVVTYRAPQGYEVLEVAGRETISGQGYWVLRNRSGTEVAVAIVRNEDAPTNRICQVGLFETQTNLVTRGGKGGYYVSSLVHWFDDRSGSLETSLLPEDGDTEVGSSDVEDPGGQDHSASLTDDPGIVGADLPEDMCLKGAAGLSDGETGAPRQTADWRVLVDAPERAIEATVFRIDANNTVVFRSSDANDRRVYRSDEISLPSLLRGVRVVIRPRQEEAVMIGGYVLCALVAWQSSETLSWTLCE